VYLILSLYESNFDFFLLQLHIEIEVSTIRNNSEAVWMKQLSLEEKFLIVLNFFISVTQ
jgi:hypothetical protein